MSENISKAYSNYKKSPKERLTATYIESRLENLDTIWDNFTKVHNDIVGAVEKEDKEKLTYFSDDTYMSVEEIYTKYKGILKSDFQARVCISKTVTSDEKSQPPMSCEVKLPQIKLPTFSGQYDEWQTFSDLFVSLIHKNPNLSEVQKLHYMKASLSGEPEILLRNFATTDSNYEEAWTQLTRRYDNKRYNTNEIMRRLFSQKAIAIESASAIKQLLDMTSTCLKSLNNIEVCTDGWDPIVNYLIISKLDSESRKQWEIQVSQEESNGLPSWSQLMRFLESRFRTLGMIDKHSTSNSKQFVKQRTLHSAVNEDNKPNSTSIICVFCSNNHLLYQCKKFEKILPEARSEFVQSNRLCFNCFAPTHAVKFCHQSMSCARCGRRHNTLLHFERARDNDESAVAENPTIETSGSSTEDQQPNREIKRVVAHFAQGNIQSEVLLPTAMVRVKTANGYARNIRALIDQGSEASFVSEATVESLGLKRLRVNGLVSGIGDGHTKTESMVSFKLESLLNPEFSLQVNAFVVNTLTSLIPSSQVSITNWSMINNLPLADPTYGSPGRVGLILGVDVYSEILLRVFIRHPTLSGPIAQNTTLGWILSGRVCKRANECLNSHVLDFHLQVSEDQSVKQLSEIEQEPDCRKRKMTKEEHRCEVTYYEGTTMTNSNGRNLVSLPFNNSNPEYIREGSKEIVLRRFKLINEIPLKKPREHIGYETTIRNYRLQNRMEPSLDGSEFNNANVVRLPHRSIIREIKRTRRKRPRAPSHV